MLKSPLLRERSESAGGVVVTSIEKEPKGSDGSVAGTAQVVKQVALESFESHGGVLGAIDVLKKRLKSIGSVGFACTAG